MRLSKIDTFLFFEIILCQFTCAQGLIFSDSNLPIVMIKGFVENNQISDNQKILTEMKIIYRGRGERNYLADVDNPAYLNYNGLIDIKIRGSSTQEYGSKKQYHISTLNPDLTNHNVSLLGMPPEHEWILNGMAFDRSFIRDYLCFNLSRQIGEYAPRAVYCELVIAGEYKGLYLLVEKIKPDDNRVNITKIGMNDISLPELSGGYITKAEYDTGGDPIAWVMKSWTGADVLYHDYYPKPEDIIEPQDNYIHNMFNSLDAKAMAGNESASDGFPSVIDIPSFIHYMIIQELTLNRDAYDNSTYFNKDRNGKLRAGPVWDFDLALGSGVKFTILEDRDAVIIGDDIIETVGWWLNDSYRGGSRFWRALFENSKFNCYFSKTWNDLIKPDHPLNFDVIERFIDQTVSTINEAVTRNSINWRYNDNHPQRILNIKNFLRERLKWMTDNLGPYVSCCDVKIPSLVIAKIMYHPETSTYSTDNDNLEFIVLTNNSDKNIDLTGVYFGGTGFGYQFPVNSFLGPYKSLVLASNTEYFQLKYDFKPFGQFSRHLSNKSENLLLLDAFGNIIDNVNYSDSFPWPDADGNGYYLELPEARLDNSVAGNWIASATILSPEDYSGISIVDYISSAGNNVFCVPDMQLFPIPVRNKLKIKADFEMKSISLYDSLGRLLETNNVDSEEYELDMNPNAKGLYILRIISKGETQTVKILKN